MKEREEEKEKEKKQSVAREDVFGIHCEVRSLFADLELLIGVVQRLQLFIGLGGLLTEALKELKGREKEKGGEGKEKEKESEP